MTDPQRTDTDQLQQEIEHTREDLARTVDALTGKLDVKAQASRKARSVQASVASAAAQAKQAAPPPIQAAIDKGAAALAPTMQRIGPYAGRIAVGCAVAVLSLTLIRRRRHAS